MTIEAPVLTLTDLSLSYGTTCALRDVTGTVRPGEAVALVGPNGSGKTTLLRGVLGLARVSGGHLAVLGEAPGRQRRGTIAYVPQVADLDPTFPVSVGDVVLMGTYGELPWWRRPGSAEKTRALDALARVGLDDRFHDRFGTLSGGQQQRVLLARCLVGNPRLVLLDEPFNGLDQPSRRGLLDIITGMTSNGAALLVSTHDLVIARDACDQVAVLAGRQIAFDRTEVALSPENIEAAFGSPHAFLDQPPSHA